MENQVKNNQGLKKGFPAMTDQAPKRRRGSRSSSEYKKSLSEKQALKRLYGLSEKQFKKYVRDALERMQKVENVSDELIKKLEKRLDNVVFRLAFAKSRMAARQLVSHAYFLVNDKSVNIPSFQVKMGDLISIKENKKKKGVFNNLSEILKKYNTPSWLEIEKNKFEGKIIGSPTLSEVNPPVEISLIFEFYSR